jgi:CRP/FNR family transcriptional regulator, cyclic AMP receptor protein
MFMESYGINPAISFLEETPVFSGIFNGDKNDLFGVASESKARRRECVYQPGDKADKIYWIKSGRVKVYRINEDGREVIHALYQAGDVLGEMAFFDKRPRETFAEVIEDATFAVIKRNNLFALAKKKPIIIYRLAKVVGERRREAEREKEQLILKGVRERLAGLLLKLGDNYGVEDSRGKMLKVKITHKDLASLVGSSRETVTLVMSELRRLGVLGQNSDRKIIITDQEQLQSLS